MKNITLPILSIALISQLSFATTHETCQKTWDNSQAAQGKGAKQCILSIPKGHPKQIVGVKTGTSTIVKKRGEKIITVKCTVHAYCKTLHGWQYVNTTYGLGDKILSCNAHFIINPKGSPDYQQCPTSDWNS